MEFIGNVTKYGFMQQDRPVLSALVKGNEDHPELTGRVYMYFLPTGVYLQGDFDNLPPSSQLAFHVHEGRLCNNLGEVMLTLPDLMSEEDGSATLQLCVGRADCTQLAGRAVVLHLKSGDTETQIACGFLNRIL